ncbi:penicillin-binding protein 2 [Tepidicaulis sp.]|uniref:penicillin-binding protein 2 n=1 Tax=Tepidicaulis sp. TaxID=1920809 RepID=UPI003B5CAE00
MLMDGKDNVRYKTFSRRAALIGGLQFAAFTALASRMYYLQIIKSGEYTMLAEENRINKRLLAPLRGEIVDRFGDVLVSNRQNFRVMLVPEQTPHIEATLDKLSRIVPLPDRQRARIIKDARTSPSFLPILVAENLDWETFAEVNIHEPDLPGIVPDVGDTRHYPYGPDLAHVVGYVAAVSEKDLEGKDDPLLKLPGFRIGKSGIERELDQELRGRAGASHVEVNAYGRVIRELAKDPGVPGAQVSLTLDMEVQKLATERLRGESASVVVMDIYNGDVIAIVSAPGFDPNDFNVGISQKKWDALLNDPYNPLLNKSIAGQYPPGSTFKPVVALAAYESGMIDPNHKVFCSGKYSLGSHDFHCWKKHGHGAMDMHDAIMHSCDVYFYEVAKRIGIDRIEAMARRFGLGDTLGFEVPGEKKGFVPSQGWKRATRGEPWHQGETLIAGIGQGFLLTTPLQLAVMTARLANGGKAVTPRIVRKVGSELDQHGPYPELGFSQPGLALVRKAMDSVSNVPGGTAYRSRITEEGMELAGKTGTAQVRRISRAERESGVLKNEDLEWRQRDHALFIAFAPVDAPRYAISVVVEHGSSGSGTAAPIARDVMKKVLERHPQREIAMRRSNEWREG